MDNLTSDLIVIDTDYFYDEAFGRHILAGIAIIDGNGNVLFNKACSPTAYINYECHNVTPAEAVADEICAIIKSAKFIVGYSVEFDLDLISDAIGGVSVITSQHTLYDVMHHYANLVREPYHRGGYKFQTLRSCAEHYGFPDAGLIRSSSGCLLNAQATHWCFRQMTGTADVATDAN